MQFVGFEKRHPKEKTRREWGGELCHSAKEQATCGEAETVLRPAGGSLGRCVCTGGPEARMFRKSGEREGGSRDPPVIKIFKEGLADRAPGLEV